MCLSNIEVIGQSVVEIQLLPVSENKRVLKFKSRSRDPAAWLRFALIWSKKGKDRIKSHKSVNSLFDVFGENPHITDLPQNLHVGWCPRHNHVCQISEWNFEGLRFYRESNFPFSYWFLNGHYNNAALYFAILKAIASKHSVMVPVWQNPNPLDL